MSAGLLRVVMIALFAAAAVLTAVAGEQEGPLFAAAFACFAVGVIVFFRWRRAQRDEAQRASVFDREEKTAEKGAE